MGGALSSNTANAVTDVTNSVSTKVGQDSTASNTCSSQLIFKNCSVKTGRDFNAINVCKNSANIKQYQKATIQSNLNNMIAQQMTQKASSVVGALGVGFADANNTANAFVGASSKISNSINQTARSINDSKQRFSCVGSTFTVGRDFNIKQFEDSNFISNQVLDAGVSNKIVNDIKQSISQTASAKVEGLTGLILALAVLVIAVGIMFAAPVKAVFSNKYLMITLIVVVILIILVVMYLRKSWPFFNGTPYITLNQPCSDGELVDVQDNKTIKLDTAPTRYHYPLWDSKRDSISLLMMGVAGRTSFPGKDGKINDSEMKQKSRLDVLKYVDDINDAIKNMNGIKSFNIDIKLSDDSSAGEYYEQLQTQMIKQFSTNREQLKILRYVMCKDINGTSNFFDLNIKIDGDYTQTSKKDNIYTFTPKDIDITNWDCIEGLGGGTINGKFGVCPTNSYKFQKFIRKGGFAILILMVLFPIIYLLVLKPKKGDMKK